MKILLIYKNANNQKITDISKPMQGGAEKFCKSIFDHFDNVDVYQVNQLDDHELDIKEKQKISQNILNQAKNINADIIISNFNHAIHNGKVMQKSHIPIMQIVHSIDLFPSIITRLKHLHTNGHSVFFVSKWQL